MIRHWLKEALPKKHDISFLNEAAKALLGIQSATWRWKSSEAVNGGFIVVGSETSLIQRGPRKGKLKWVGKEERCVITPGHINEQQRLFEEKTGDCWCCYGLGSCAIGWCCTRGTCYIKCSRCNGSGQSPSKTRSKETY